MAATKTSRTASHRPLQRHGWRPARPDVARPPAPRSARRGLNPQRDPPRGLARPRGLRPGRRGLPAILLVPFLLVSVVAACSENEPDDPLAPVPMDPPFGGTIFIDPDIVTPDDPTTFESVTYAGRGTRTMFDRRPADWVTVEAFLFEAVYDDGLEIEIQVNPEFGTEGAARAEAEKYGRVVGHLPTVLRTEVETMWIHQGTEPFGGGNQNLLVHVGQAALYEDGGILEETFMHEAVHTSVDPFHADAEGWRAAQEADPTFISEYAEEFPDREDLAESFVPWVAVRFRGDRISASLADTITATMPNRIAYFDEHFADLHPID